MKPKSRDSDPILPPPSTNGDYSDILPIVNRVMERKKINPNPVPESEVQARLYGQVIGSRKFDGIRGYNKTQILQGQPWHCATVSNVVSSLLEWGRNPLKYLKAIREIGFVPSKEPVVLPD